MQADLDFNINGDGIEKDLKSIDKSLTKTQRVGLKAAQKVLGGFVKLGKGLGNTVKSIVSVRGAIAGLAGAGGLALLTKNTFDSIDAIGKLNQITGISTEQLGSLKLAAELSGTGFEALVNSSIKLSKGINEFVVRDAGLAKEAFKQMGISAEDLGPIMNDSQKQLEFFADSFASMENGATKSALAFQIFGGAGTELIPLLNEGSAGMKRIRMEAEEMGISMSTGAVRGVEAANDAMTRFTFRIKGAFASTVSNIAPLVETAFTKMSSTISNFIEGKGGIQNVGKLIATSFIGGIQLAVRSFSSFVNLIINGLNSIIKIADKIPGSGINLIDASKMESAKTELLAINSAITAVRKNETLSFKEKTKQTRILVEQMGDVRNVIENGTTLFEGFDVTDALTVLDTFIQQIETSEPVISVAIKQQQQEQITPVAAADNTFGPDAPDASVIDKVLAQEAAIAQAKTQSAVTELERLRMTLMTENQLIDGAYIERSNIVITAAQNELLTVNESQQLMTALEMEHSQQRLDIASREAQGKLQMFSSYGNAVSGIFSGLSQLVGKESKRSFENQKKLNYAGAVTSTAAAVANALATAPFPLGLALAAGAAASGAAQIATISKTSFSGGGSAPSAPSISASPVSASIAQPSQPVSQADLTPTPVNVNINIVDPSQAVIQTIQREVSEGDLVLIDSASSQADILRA